MISIVLVNYRTPTQTKLCLRSLRRYTRTENETIVVDNRSGDASAAYLRGLPWIRFLENPAPEPTHRNALDLAVTHAQGDVVCILHSDTFVRREGWLETLASRMQPGDWILGSPDRLLLPVRGLGRLSTRWKRRKLERRWRERGRVPKILSHCALYRRALFTEHGQRFDHPQYIDGVYNDCGEMAQRYCETNGMAVRTVRREDLAPLMWHFEAATLNFVTGRRVAWKRRFRAWRFYRRADVRAILADDALDR